MKKFNLLVILAIFGAISANLSAQRLKNRHSLGVWVEGAEWSMLVKDAEFANSLGVAGVVGGAYELQRGHFLFDAGIGAGVGYGTFNTQDQSAVLKDAIDYIDEERFNFVYQMAKRSDDYTNLSLQIPVMVGGTWNRFYFLAGAKLYANMMTWTRVNGLLITYGDYAAYDDFRDMPEYGFVSDKEATYKGRTNFNLDVDASIELGAKLGYLEESTGYDVPKAATQYRIAVFADYGLLDLHKSQSKAALVTPTEYTPGEGMLNGVTMNDILSTNGAAKMVNNLMVGVKFTVLFQLPEPRNCVICNQNRLRSRKGRTKILEELVF